MGKDANCTLMMNEHWMRYDESGDVRVSKKSKMAQREKKQSPSFRIIIIARATPDLQAHLWL